MKFFVNEQRIECDTDRGRRIFDKDKIIKVLEIKDPDFSYAISVATHKKRPERYRISYESFEHLRRHIKVE
jgi:hypothetical protein